MSAIRRFPILAGLSAVLAGCSQAPSPPATPSSSPVQAVLPPVSLPPMGVVQAPANWRDSPITPGDWHWSQSNAISEAQFGAANGLPQLSLRCLHGNGGARISLIRYGAVNSSWLSGPPAITVATTSLTKALNGELVKDGIAMLFSPHDPLLDAMAFSRGRFAVEVEGLSPVYAPSWPEVSRVIEDCR